MITFFALTLIGLIVVIMCLIIRLAYLSRRTRELHDALCRLEGAENIEECQNEDSRTGDAEGM